ncbi:hypothetical protein ACFVZD_34560 [Streptomyces sp. NPDC058287]|uniref:hypothetical protein n=1 Tax=Streptomyces sp. NPDC058287 TaxID=3346423 RepID=UPI0036ECD8CC
MQSLRTGVLLLLAAVPVLLFGSAGTAQAHPFGTPPVVRIEASGHVVDAAWSAQQDDIAVVKKHSGGDVSRYLRSRKVAVALAMVAAFGVGMALTLTGVGVLVLRSRDALLDCLLRSRALRTWTLKVPVFAASAVVVGGTVASALAAGQLRSP